MQTTLTEHLNLTNSEEMIPWRTLFLDFVNASYNFDKSLFHR